MMMMMVVVVVMMMMSMDWLKGRENLQDTGNHDFYHQMLGFPVDFPLIQSNDDADDDNDSPASFPSCGEEAPRMMHDASSSPSRKDGGTAVVLLKFLGSWENDGECIESTRIHGGYPGRMVGYGWLVVQSTSASRFHRKLRVF